MRHHRRRRLLLVLIAFIFIGILIALFTREDVLPQYIKPEEESTTEGMDTKFEIIAPVKDESFRISVPEGLKKVDDKDTVYYLSDKLNITIKKSQYTHINAMYTADTYAQTLSGNAGIMSFDYPSTSSRLVSYKRATEDAEIINVILTVWDRKVTIDVIYEISSNIYEEYLPIIRKSIDSYTWESEYSIASNLCMGYSEYGNCDYAVPLGFNNVSTSNMYAYSNNEGTIYTTLEIYENSGYLENINNIKYIEYAGNNKSGYTLRNYNVTKKQIYAESYYTDTNRNSIVYMYQKVIATGSKQYFITYYVDKNVLNDELLATINNAFTYFKIR